MNPYSRCCTSGRYVKFQLKTCKDVNFHSTVKISLALTMHLLTIFASDCVVKVLMGNFNHPNWYRRDNTTGYTQPWRFLDGINFFTQVTEKSMGPDGMHPQLQG